MKLSKKADRVLGIFVAITLVIVAGVSFSAISQNTFADGEIAGAVSYASEGSKFVILHDNGKKTIVKTDAQTVAEALARANVTVSSGDTVEPSLETEINASNFHINIYRSRPVMIEVGTVQKYLMTSSYDPKTIAKEAGLTIYDGDQIDLATNSDFLEAGVANVYKITRNGGRTVTVDEEIAFSEETIKDFNLSEGASEVRQLGEIGTRRTVYHIEYLDGVEVSREKISEEVVKAPVARIVAVGVSAIERSPLSASKGAQVYTYTKADGSVVTRRETYYDLDMASVIHLCGSSYSVRSDGVKVDQDGYVLVAANLARYPRCSVVETSVGLGKVYDTGGFAATNPEQFDIATDWSNHNGR